MMIKQRLLDICEALNISANQFSIDIGMSRSYIANLKKGHNNRSTAKYTCQIPFS